MPRPSVVNNHNENEHVHLPETCKLKNRSKLTCLAMTPNVAAKATL